MLQYFTWISKRSQYSTGYKSVINPENGPVLVLMLLSFCLEVLKKATYCTRVAAGLVRLPSLHQSRRTPDETRHRLLATRGLQRRSEDKRPALWNGLAVGVMSKKSSRSGQRADVVQDQHVTGTDRTYNQLHQTSNNAQTRRATTGLSPSGCKRIKKKHFCTGLSKEKAAPGHIHFIKSSRWWMSASQKDDLPNKGLKKKNSDF